MKFLEVAQDVQSRLDEAGKLKDTYGRALNEWADREASYQEQIIRLESYNDLKSETILQLQSEVERHKQHKQRIITAVQRGLDNMDLLQQELHSIKIEDAEQPKKSNASVEDLLKKMADQIHDKPRGFSDVLKDNQNLLVPKVLLET